MSTFKHIGNKIYIDGLMIPVGVFQILEPSYKQQDSMEALTYDGKTLNVRINGTTTTVSGKWSDGERYISRKKDFMTLTGLINKEDIEVADNVDSIRDPVGCRKNAYPLADDLVVALWEHIVEKKDRIASGIADLQAKRLVVKDKYPLKETTQNANNQLTDSAEGVLPKGTRRTRSGNKSSG
jgi:hypothetical protein